MNFQPRVDEAEKSAYSTRAGKNSFSSHYLLVLYYILFEIHEI